MRSWWGIGNSRTAWAAVTVKCWMELKSLRERRAHSKLTVMDFKRAVLVSSGICLEEYHGIKPQREEGLKKAVKYSRIIPSKLRSNASQQR